jgi:hypothetical protein
LISKTQIIFIKDHNKGKGENKMEFNKGLIITIIFISLMFFDFIALVFNFKFYWKIFFKPYRKQFDTSIEKIKEFVIEEFSKDFIINFGNEEIYLLKNFINYPIGIPQRIIIGKEHTSIIAKVGGANYQYIFLIYMLSIPFISTEHKVDIFGFAAIIIFILMVLIINHFSAKKILKRITNVVNAGKWESLKIQKDQ